MRTGLISRKNKQSIEDETISSTTLNTLTFHLSLLLDGSLWISSTKVLVGFAELFVCLPSWHINVSYLETDEVYYYIDSRIISRISCTATDYLVFFGIVSIKVSVVIEYAVLLLMLLIFVMIIVTLLWSVGPQTNNESCFEWPFFVYGYFTEIFAIDFVLLRIVDPDNQSKTLNDTAIDGSFNTLFEMFVWSFGPYHAHATPTLAICRFLPGSDDCMLCRLQNLRLVGRHR